MSIEVRLGRWRMRNGETAVVVDCDGIFSWPWRGRIERDTQLTSWSRGGRWGPVPGTFDLAEYLGPLPDTAPAPKRYWLFAGNDYYATGGMHDFEGSFDSVAEAEEHARKSLDSDQWYHVVDVTTGQIVAGTKYQGYGAPALTPEQIGGEA